MRGAPGLEAGDSSSSEGDSSVESAGEDEPAQPARRLTRAAAARQRPAPNGDLAAPADPPSNTDGHSPEHRKQDAAPARRVTRAAAAKRRTTREGPDAAAAGEAPSGRADQGARPTQRLTRAAAARLRAPPSEEESSSSEFSPSALLMMLRYPYFFRSLLIY